MPELLLRDEDQTTAKWEEELPLRPKTAYIDTNVILHYPRYVDYLLRHKEIKPFFFKYGREEVDLPEYTIGGQLPASGSPFAHAWDRLWSYQHDPDIWFAGTASEPSNAVYYEIKYAQPTKATIAAVLSQTAEYLGYSIPRQLDLNIEPPAFKLLENLTLSSLTQKALDMIASEKSRGTPIRSVVITSFKDPEAIDCEQLVIKVCLDCDSDTALQIWDNLSRDIEELKKDLHPHEINVLDERLGLDCEW